MSSLGLGGLGNEFEQELERHPSLDAIPDKKLRQLECIMIGAKDSARMPGHMIASQVGFEENTSTSMGGPCTPTPTPTPRTTPVSTPGRKRQLGSDTNPQERLTKSARKDIGALKQYFTPATSISAAEQQARVVSAYQQELSEAKALAEAGRQAASATMISLLRNTAEQESKQRYQTYLRDNVRLGCLTNRRDGHVIQEVWEDGESFRDFFTQQNALKTEKEEIDALKKEFAHASKNEITTESSLTDLISLTELEEIIKCRQTALKQDIAALKLEESTLQYRKMLHIKFSRLLADEAHSRFNQNPVLNARYVLLFMVGKGGFSEVYKAFDLVEHKYVALKLHEINQTWNNERKENFVRHAYRENEILQKLNHPRVVNCYDIFLVNNNTLCSVLEFCEGEDLDSFLKRKGTLSEKYAKCIMLQLFRGLHYLNSQKPVIIHYDLKPANILIHKGEIKIADFGLSKLMEDESSDRMELTTPGYGSYWYLPPECFVPSEGFGPPQISSKVDVWSAGVIYYQMLYGKKPVGDGMSPGKQLIDTIVQSGSLEFPAKPDVSSHTKEFIARCISGDHNTRPDVSEVFSGPYFFSSSKIAASKHRRE